SLSLTRYVRALAIAKGDFLAAEELIKARWPADQGLIQYARAAAVPGTTSNTNWAQPLAALRPLSSEFVEVLRPSSVVLRLANARRIPFNVKIARETQASAAAWVGENSPKPVSQLAFDSITMDFRKLVGIVVISQELARFSAPSAEAVIQQDLSAVLNG